jgi:hypothetical protein
MFQLAQTLGANADCRPTSWLHPLHPITLAVCALLPAHADVRQGVLRAALGVAPQAPLTATGAARAGRPRPHAAWPGANGAEEQAAGSVPCCNATAARARRYGGVPAR